MWAHTEIFARKALYTGKVNVIKNIYRECKIERERESPYGNAHIMRYIMK